MQAPRFIVEIPETVITLKNMEPEARKPKKALVGLESAICRSRGPPVSYFPGHILDSFIDDLLTAVCWWH